MPTPVRTMDVAAYILEKQGRMTTWKLQKLCYYSQAWSLVWDEEPLFEEHIEAWAGGPVIRALYEWHKGEYFVTKASKGDPTKLDKDQSETVDAILAYYGDKSGPQLADLTHQELPWRQARLDAGLLFGERGNAEITLDSMAEFYTGLYITAQ